MFGVIESKSLFNCNLLKIQYKGIRICSISKVKYLNYPANFLYTQINWLEQEHNKLEFDLMEREIDPQSLRDQPGKKFEN